MANPKQDVNGHLADNDRFATAKKRVLASKLMTPKQQKRSVDLLDELMAIYTEVCLEHAGAASLFKSRLPRRRDRAKKATNGHAIAAAKQEA